MLRHDGVTSEIFADNLACRKIRRESPPPADLTGVVTQTRHKVTVEGSRPQESCVDGGYTSVLPSDEESPGSEEGPRTYKVKGSSSSGKELKGHMREGFPRVLRWVTGSSHS